MKMMILVLILFFTTMVSAQSTAPGSGNKRVVALYPSYQTVTLEDSAGNPLSEFSEFGTRFLVLYPVNQTLKVSLNGSGAKAEPGDGSTNSESLSGLGDMQLGATYELSDANTVLAIRLNIPTGKKELTDLESATSAEISNPIYRLAVPGFGQGFNVAPSISWANPANEKLILGLGASYHYRGAYKYSAAKHEYDPGDEILLTGGMDIRFTENASLSTDVIFTMYSNDVSNGNEIFAAGNKVTVNSRFRRYLGYDEFTILGRFRSRGNNELIAEAIESKTVPNSFDLLVSFNRRFTPVFSAMFGGEAQFFETLEGVLSGGELYSAIIRPSFRAGENAIIGFNFQYRLGTLKDSAQRDFSGLTAGASLTLLF